MSEQIVQLNEQVIKAELKDLSGKVSRRCSIACWTRKRLNKCAQV